MNRVATVIVLTLALSHVVRAQTIVQGPSAESLSAYKTYYPFVSLVSRGAEIRVVLPNELIPVSLLRGVSLEKVSLKDRRGKIMVTAKDLAPTTTPGEFVISPRKPITEKSQLKGFRGVATFRLTVPAQSQAWTLTKPGDNGGGWTFTTLNRGQAGFACIGTCTDVRVELLQGSNVVEPKAYQRGPNEIQVTLPGPVSAFRLMHTVSVTSVSWTSQIVPDESIEPRPVGVYFYEKPRPADAGVCLQKAPELVRLFKLDVKRAENAQIPDQLHLDFNFTGPGCLNTKMAKAYKALELYAGGRDLTGKISGLAGDAEIGTSSIEMDTKETSFDVAKHPLLEAGDAPALKEALVIRGIYTVRFPQITLTKIALDSDDAEKRGLVVQRSRKVWILKGRGLNDQTEVLALNGLAIRPLSKDVRGAVTTLVYPVEPHDLRQVSEVSSLDLSVPVSVKVAAAGAATVAP